jgi:hypothetical protein
MEGEIKSKITITIRISEPDLGRSDKDTFPGVILPVNPLGPR